MRKLIASLLVLSPVLLHAQASKQVADVNLQARKDALKMFMPVAAASVPTTTTIPAQPLRISTGISSAKLVSKPSIPFTASELNSDESKVVVRLLVNEKGAVEDAEIVKSLSPKMDQRVLAAARAAQFRPAILDEQAVAQHVNLTFVFQK
ncbi:MAG: TonB family protein [Acidobacteriaceae bacterium]|jgi:TonB family protein|nr:TonB family protein [Acidobacteriaceae bacterium]